MSLYVVNSDIVLLPKSLSVECTWVCHETSIGILQTGKDFYNIGFFRTTRRADAWIANIINFAALATPALPRLVEKLSLAGYVESTNCRKLLIMQGTSSKNSRAIIALGANLGLREEIFAKAIKAIDEEIGPVIKKSCWYETDPLVHPLQPTLNQPKYLNGIIVVSTPLFPEQILEYLLNIERTLGRRRGETEIPWAPRTIDLDLIAHEDLVWKSHTLTLPHPEMHKREFVLKPLLEVWPEWQHPILKKTVRELWEELRGTTYTRRGHKLSI